MEWERLLRQQPTLITIRKASLLGLSQDGHAMSRKQQRFRSHFHKRSVRDHTDTDFRPTHLKSQLPYKKKKYKK